MENKKDIKTIEDWAEYYVPEFNKHSDEYKTPYYTQSPLSNVDERVELMVVGINPKGELGTGKRELTWKEYLEGNDCWKDRFLNDGTMHPDWEKGVFLPNIHFFLGYDNYYHPESIDSDTKTIITNISPFCSKNGFSDLPPKLRQIGLESIASLFSLVKPKRIVLLGIGAFDSIQANMEDKNNVSFEYIYKSFCVGQICGIPTVNVIHPASRNWDVPNSFPPIFIYLHKLATDKFKLDIKKVADYMRKQIDAYKKL